jgi:hypothetical protein
VDALAGDDSLIAAGGRTTVDALKLLEAERFGR